MSEAKHDGAREEFCTVFDSARGGDPQAREEIARLSYEALCKHFHGRLGPLARLEQTEDVVSATIRNVLEALPNLSFRGEAQWHAFLYRCAENCLRDRLKYYEADKRRAFDVISLETALAHSDATGDSLVEGGPGPVTTVEHHDELRLVEECLDELQEEDAAVARLKMVGYSVGEISARLDRPRDDVELRLRRAMARLASRLQVRRRTSDGEAGR